MYFVNMTSNEKIRINRGNSKADFVCDTCESPFKGYVTYNNGELQVSDTGTNLFVKGLTGNPDEVYQPIRKRKSQLTYKMIADTEENPLVVVLCRQIAIYDGVPAGLKYIYMDDNTILACLIYGVCEFDGVPMQRCNTQVFETKKKKIITGKGMKELSSCKDKETEYSYLKDVVNQVEILYKDAVMGESITYRTSLDSVLMFDDSGLKVARKKKEEFEKRRRELQAKREAEELRKRAELKAKEDEERQKEQEKVFQATSLGAANFLKAVSEGAR